MVPEETSQPYRISYTFLAVPNGTGSQYYPMFVEYIKFSPRFADYSCQIWADWKCRYENWRCCASPHFSRQRSGRHGRRAEWCWPGQPTFYKSQLRSILKTRPAIRARARSPSSRNPILHTHSNTPKLLRRNEQPVSFMGHEARRLVCNGDQTTGQTTRLL